MLYSIHKTKMILNYNLMLFVVKLLRKIRYIMKWIKLLYITLLPCHVHYLLYLLSYSHDSITASALNLMNIHLYEDIVMPSSFFFYPVSSFSIDAYFLRFMYNHLNNPIILRWNKIVTMIPMSQYTVEWPFWRHYFIHHGEHKNAILEKMCTGNIQNFKNTTFV